MDTLNLERLNFEPSFPGRIKRLNRLNGLNDWDVLALR